MGYARYIGRVGTLATALGVAAVVGNTPGVALADDLGANAPSSESSSESSKAGPANQPASDPSTPPDPSNVSSPPAQTTPSETATQIDTRPVTIIRSSGGALTSSPDTETTEPPQDAVTETELPAPTEEQPEPVTAEDAPPTAIQPTVLEQTEAVEPESNSLPPAAATPTNLSTGMAEVATTTVDDPPETMHAAPMQMSAPPNIVDDQFTAMTAVADPTTAAESEQLPTAVEQPAEAVFSGPLTPLNAVVSALTGIFDNPLLGNGPAAPVEPPIMWAVMAFARSQFKQMNSVVPVSGCACAGGLVLAQWGTATCEADGIGSFAFVLGDNSSATATGAFSTAFVLGNNGIAHTADGDFNTAVVIGDGGLVKAGVAGDPNDFNTAIALFGGQAFAGSGGNDGDENDHNLAIALGADSEAAAGGFWDDGFNTFDPDNNDHNTAIAINGSVARASVNGHDNSANVALAAGPNSHAAAAGRDNDHDGNFALAVGVNAGAFAGGFGAGVEGFNNDGNFAAAIGQDSGALAGNGCPALCGGGDNTGNTALALGNAALAQAGSSGEDLDGNSAFAAGPGSIASAGSDANDLDGYSATATAGVPVIEP